MLISGGAVLQAAFLHEDYPAELCAVGGGVADEAVGEAVAAAVDGAAAGQGEVLDLVGEDQAFLLGVPSLAISLCSKEGAHFATAARFAREGIAKAFELIVALGGDGTISEVANGFFEDGKPIGSAALGVNVSVLMPDCGSAGVNVTAAPQLKAMAPAAR